MKVGELIKNLRTSGLFAECPCGLEFPLSDAFFFDGTKPFPQEALKLQAELKKELEERERTLTKSIKELTELKAKRTAAVNIGKSLEKVLPAAKDFKWSMPDSKFLGDPIDLIIFNGLSNNQVENLSFVEVKTGPTARLNLHQRAIRDAVEDHRVSYGVFE